MYLLAPVIYTPQQKNMELLTFLCNLGSSGMGMPPSEAGLEPVSDESSKFKSCPI